MAKAPEINIIAPRENPHLFGFEAAQQSFVADFAAGKLHHAYLISGPKGIGKATFAYRMARYVLGHGALKVQTMDAGPSLFGDALPAAPAANPELDMDPQSPLFRRIANGSHTDLLALAPAYDAKKGAEKASISIDESRRVPTFLSMTPAEGDWRVVVIDAIDQLTNQAANALLKILEEPPANALLLLVCHEPGSILPTIKSRCRQFALPPPARAAFEQTLQTVAPSIDITDYPALYALSYGSPGLAITLTKHRTVPLYAGWLKALQPTANDEVRERFVNEASSIKSPEAWAMLLHTWEVAMHRLTLFPHHDQNPIIPRESEQLQAIAQAVPFATRQRWLAAARYLVSVTDTYNLDKHYTIRLMLDPERVSTQFAAAA